MIQGLKTNLNDPECHILCFDIEALIGKYHLVTKFNLIYFKFFIIIILVQLLNEEYSVMSPKTMESKGLINTIEYQNIASLTHPITSDTHKKITGM